MIVRPRNDGDLDICERVARLVQELDGYPALLSDGLRDFVEGRGFYDAWVAEVDREVVGQVLLRPRTSPKVMEMLRQATGLADDRFGVIARLFVSPAMRRRGIGRALMTTATAAAVSRGLVPVLDVVTKNKAAIALYESMGWVRVGTAAVQFQDGPVLDEVVYVGHDAPAPGPPLRE